MDVLVTAAGDLVETEETVSPEQAPAMICPSRAAICRSRK